MRSLIVIKELHREPVAFALLKIVYVYRIFESDHCDAASLTQLNTLSKKK